MRHVRNRLSLAVLAAILLLPGLRARADLQTAVETDLARLRTTIAAVVVLDDHGRTLVDINSERPMKPASTLKLCTALAALDVLGASATVETRLLACGPLRDGVLLGDLVLVGAGDPTLSGRLFDEDIYHVYREMAARLNQAGIQQITGSVIGDDRLFDREVTGPGWKKTDLTRWYSARVSALSFNDNCIDVLWNPGKTRGRAPVWWSKPKCRYFSIINRVTVSQSKSHSRLHYAYTDRPGTLIARGRLNHRAGVREETVALPDPAWWAAAGLAHVLQQTGIPVEGDPVTIHDVSATHHCSDGRVVARYRSPAVAELVKIMNYRSQNLFAELFVKRLGKATADEGSFAAGTRAIRQALAARGIDTAKLHNVDGSGLSHDNRITARLLAEVLHAGSHQPAFRHSLPVAGDEDGSLRYYLSGRRSDREQQHRVHGKTGYIQGVRGLAGYLDNPDGTSLTYVVLLNNLPSRPGAGIPTITRILRTLLACESSSKKQ